MLLHALIDVLAKKVDRKTAVSTVLKECRALAVHNGITVDAKYRNENGVALQMSKLEYVFTKGKSGLAVDSGWYFGIVELYESNPKQFERLLEGGTEMVSSANELRERYFVWLSGQVSPAQLSELYMAYEEIETYFRNQKILEKSLFQTTELKTLDEIRSTIEGNESFRFTYKRSIRKMSFAIKFYMKYMEEFQGDLMSAKENKTFPVAGFSTVAIGEVKDFHTNDLKVLADSGTSGSGRKMTSQSNLVSGIDGQDGALGESNNNGVVSTDLEEIRSYAYMVPVSFSYFGDVSPVSNWKELYVGCCKVLCEDYPAVFESLRGKTIIGNGRLDIGDAESVPFMKSAKQIESGLYVETNLSATDLMKRLRQLLVLCKVDFENLIIEYHGDSVSIFNQASKGRDELHTPYIKRLGQEALNVSRDIVDNYMDVLRSDFPDGMRQNIIHVKKFIQRYEERFAAIETDRDELLDQLRSVGVVRGDRIFPRQDDNQRALLDDIYIELNHVFKNGGTHIYLSMILLRYGQQLAKQFGVYNEVSLQALISEQKPSGYYIRHGYVCNTSERVDLKNDVLRFMQNCYEPMTYDAIQASLWYIPMEKIKQALVCTPSLVNVDQESYFYAPNLPIAADELQILIRVMQDEIEIRGFLVGQHLKGHCPSAAIDTAFMKDWGIRNAIGYILRDHFEFTGALVTKKGQKFSLAQAYHNFCKDREQLTLEQLKEFSADVGA